MSFERKPAWAASLDRDEYHPKCDRCEAFARWSIANYENDDSLGSPQWVTRWFACGRHLTSVLNDGDWWCDSVQLYDLTGARS